MKRDSQLAAFAFGLVVLVMPAMAQAASFRNIDPPGSTTTFPFGINPQGDVVGNYIAGGVIHGFLLHDGNFSTIDIPGATATFARGISPQGDIVGFYVAGGVTHGFLLRES